MSGNEFGPFRALLAEFLETYGDAGRARMRDRINDRHFSEALLISLVRGNRVRAGGGRNGAPPTDLERVTLAHKAIFGTPPDAFANSRDDVRALTWMAEIREMELAEAAEAGKQPKLTSVSELAKRAHKGNVGHPMDHDRDFRLARPHISSADHLRKKFPAFWETRKRRNEECAYDLEIEVLRRMALDEIEVILRIFGVESQPED